MKAIEFNTKLENAKSITIPIKLQKELESVTRGDVRVLLLLPDELPGENAVFQSLATDQFLKGYYESDSIYDQQPDN